MDAGSATEPVSCSRPAQALPTGACIGSSSASVVVLACALSAACATTPPPKPTSTVKAGGETPEVPYEPQLSQPVAAKKADPAAPTAAQPAAGGGKGHFDKPLVHVE